MAARWVGAQGWVQSHKLLLSGWPWHQLPQRSSCSEPDPHPGSGGAGGQHGCEWERAERLSGARSGKGSSLTPDLQSFIALGLSFLKQ